jgi:hypothetical protein
MPRIRAVDEAAKGRKNAAFYSTSRRPTAHIMVEIQPKSQNEEGQMLNWIKEELEVALSRIGPQFREEMYIPLEHKDPPFGMNFGS